MILIALAVLLVAPPPPPPPPPPGLAFGYIRMEVFQHRAHELRCPAPDLDRELASILRRLQDRYGKAAFPAHKIPSGGPGGCWSVLEVYRVNLADFHKEAEAALRERGQTPAPGAR